VTQKQVGRFLPGPLRIAYSANVQKLKIHYWPRKIAKYHGALHKVMVDEVKAKFAFSDEVLTNAAALNDLSTYSDSVEVLMVDGLEDNALEERLSQLPSDVDLLYTGGGMVPARLLSLSHLRFLHIHPGFLPNIRGADCVFWSSLVFGRCSATCFIMAPGIDTGPIVKACWLPEIKFAHDAAAYDLKTLYRAIYGFFDPWVRAFVLREVFRDLDDFGALQSHAQDECGGITYHFMHPALQRKAIAVLFENDPP
jgi:hypothetical protein